LKGILNIVTNDCFTNLLLPPHFLPSYLSDPVRRHPMVVRQGQRSTARAGALFLPRCSTLRGFWRYSLHLGTRLLQVGSEYFRGWTVPLFLSPAVSRRICLCNWVRFSCSTLGIRHSRGRRSPPPLTPNAAQGQRHAERATEPSPISAPLSFAPEKDPYPPWGKAFRKGAVRWSLVLTTLVFVITLKDRLAEILAVVGFLLGLLFNPPGFSDSSTIEESG
jgi:hypothetical protein